MKTPREYRNEFNELMIKYNNEGKIISYEENLPRIDNRHLGEVSLPTLDVKVSGRRISIDELKDLVNLSDCIDGFKITIIAIWESI